MRAVSLFLIAAAALSAQSPGDPLTLIRIARKPVSARIPTATYTSAKPPVHVLAIRSITGPAQTWLIEAHGSYTSIEETDRSVSAAMPVTELEDEMLAPSVHQVALYRHGLSYRPEEAVKLLPQAKYVQVAIYRSRPGFDIDFAELIRIRRAVLDRLNLDRPEIGYQVTSGGVSGTYIFIAPLASMKTLDESVLRWLRYDIAPSPGGRSGQQIAAEAEITREELLFRVEPKWSWMPPTR